MNEQACALPLTERMRSVPRTARLHIDNEMHPTLNVVTSSSTYAVGHMLHAAADELDSLRTRLAEAEAEIEKKDWAIAAAYERALERLSKDGITFEELDGEVRKIVLCRDSGDSSVGLSATEWWEAESPSLALSEARKIVERLPKTADGVPITPGMKLYRWDTSLGALLEGGRFAGRMDEQTVSMDTYDDPDDMPQEWGWFSTRSAAELAKNKVGEKQP